MTDLAIIVPCHNEAGTVGEQLTALTGQSWSGTWEVVIVDNNSTDGTCDVAQQFADTGRVRVVAANQGSGVAYARNVGVAATDATAVAFCDGDDVVQPGWVATMGEALASNAWVTGAVNVDLLNPPWLAASRPTSAGLPRFGEIAFARGNNCGMQRGLFVELGGFAEDFVGLEDIEFSLRAVAAGHSPVFVADAQVAYRYRPQLKQVWRQALFYGRGRPELVRQARRLGLAAPGRSAALKSWAWLGVNAPKLGSKGGRAAWVWVLGNRIGSLSGTRVRH